MASLETIKQRAKTERVRNRMAAAVVEARELVERFDIVRPSTRSDAAVDMRVDRSLQFEVEETLDEWDVPCMSLTDGVIVMGTSYQAILDHEEER